MKEQLILLLVVISVLAGMIWLAYSSGKKSEKNKNLKVILKVKKRQDHAAKNAPRTKSGVIDSLSNSDF